jgi:hypothetical protein
MQSSSRLLVMGTTGGFQASPHFRRDIKESSLRRAIPERILGPAQLVDPCDVAEAIPRSRLTRIAPQDRQTVQVPCERDPMTVRGGGAW